jgi:hypothetical protein
MFCAPQVRAIKDGRGSSLPQAGPGQAVVVSGLRAIPAAGDELIVVGSDARAAKMAAARSARAEDFRQGQLARMQAEHFRRQQQLRKQEYERWVVAGLRPCACCYVFVLQGSSCSVMVGLLGLLVSERGLQPNAVEPCGRNGQPSRHGLG